MKRLAIVFALTLVASAAEAEIYKWILPNGSTEYSDRPPVEGAERVDLKPLVTYTPGATSSATSEQGETEGSEEDEGYQQFTIASPVDEAAIRDNTGEVRISFAISPALVEGHAIDIFVDGQKFASSTAAAVTLSSVNRGSHRIHAVIVDESGAELARTGTITIHLKRASNLL